MATKKKDFQQDGASPQNAWWVVDWSVKTYGGSRSYHNGKIDGQLEPFIWYHQSQLGWKYSVKQAYFLSNRL